MATKTKFIKTYVGGIITGAILNSGWTFLYVKTK